MNCLARTQLLNELSSAVEAYNSAVNRMINRDGSLPSVLREQVADARDECSAWRSALLEHEREHGCAISLVAL
jgi:hypothetical protein